MVPSVGSTENSNVDTVVQETYVTNIARNKKRSFRLSVILWVYGKEVQAEALADLRATTNFIDKAFIEKNHLVTHKLAEAFNVTNTDGTLNKAGQIKNYIRAYAEIRDHRVTIILLVASLGDKDIMIGYSYFYEHNPQIDWQLGE